MIRIVQKNRDTGAVKYGIWHPAAMRLVLEAWLEVAPLHFPNAEIFIQDTVLEEAQ